jgi:hypothetical protein
MNKFNESMNLKMEGNIILSPGLSIEFRRNYMLFEVRHLGDNKSFFSTSGGDVELLSFTSAKLKALSQVGQRPVTITKDGLTLYISEAGFISITRVEKEQLLCSLSVGSDTLLVISSIIKSIT